MEEGLLIGSDFEGGYQTIARDDETVVDQPEGTVVAKGKSKGKKKVSKMDDTKQLGQHSETHKEAKE